MERLAVALTQHPLDVRLAVEDFSSQLDIGHASRIPVFLQGASAGLQQLRHLPVCQVAFSAQHGAVVLRQPPDLRQRPLQLFEKTDHRPAFPCHQFIQFVHSFTMDLVVQSFGAGSDAFPFQGRPSAALLDDGDDALHILRTVIHLAHDLRIAQRAVAAQGLQGTGTDLKDAAHLRAVQPFAQTLCLRLAPDFLHPVYETVKTCHDFLEGLSLDNYYCFHKSVALIVNTAAK